MLTISRLARWSIGYYNDNVPAAKNSAMGALAANGGLGEYYSEADTRVPTWLLTGDTATVAGLSGWTPPRSPAGWRTPTSGGLAERRRGTQRTIRARI